MSGVLKKAKGMLCPSGMSSFHFESEGGSAKKKNAVSPAPQPLTPEAPKGYKVWTDELKVLTSFDQFIVGQANAETSPNHPSAYDVRNGSHLLLLKVVESVDSAIRDLHMKKKTIPPSSLNVFDLKAGKEIIKINVSMGPGVMIVYVRQMGCEDKVIGVIRRYNASCKWISPTFSLDRPNGKTLMYVKSAWRNLWYRCCTCHCLRWVRCPKACSRSEYGRRFKIYSEDTHSLLGLIRYSQDKFISEEEGAVGVEGPKGYINATFPEDATATNKILILAVLFMLDFQYFRPLRKPIKRPKVSKTCYIILVIVTCLTAITVVVALFGGRGFQGGSTPAGRPRPGGFG